MPDHLVGERIADQLRREILDGDFAPDQHLDEVSLAQRLGVSRNTLREAFRLLSHERLVTHEAHRGVFVRRVGAAQARDSYEVRRHLECGGVREAYARLVEARTLLSQPSSSDAARQAAEAFIAGWDAALAAAKDAVELGEGAAAAGDWHAAGTANAHFHEALGALGSNPVLASMVRSLVTESRLRFLMLEDPRAVHEPFLLDNRRILTMLEAMDVARAATELESYLLRAQRLLAAM